MFEGYGGAGVELFAAPGEFGTFDAAEGLSGWSAIAPGADLAALIDYASAGPTAWWARILQSAMLGVNASAYVRIPFTMSDPADVESIAAECPL